MSPKPRHGHHPASDGSGRILIDRYGCESQDVLNRSSTPSKPQASSCKIYSKNILLSILSIVTHIFVDYMKRNTLLKIYLSAIPLREVYFLFVPQDSISTLPLCAPPSKILCKLYHMFPCFSFQFYPASIGKDYIRDEEGGGRDV